LEGSFGLIVSLVIAIFLFIDAPKHGKSRWLWAILGLIFGPITLGIYLIRTGRRVLGWIITIVAILMVLIIIVMLVAAAALFLKGGF